MAHDTSLSLEHWTIALALISIAVTAGLTVKRRYFGRKPAPALAPAKLESIHAPDATPPGLGRP